MTFAEARDWVEQAIRPIEVSSGEIDRLLNLENDNLSRELRIPTRFIKNIDATQPFLISANTRNSGLVRIWNESDGEHVPVYTIQNASIKYPRWLNSPLSVEGANFVVWEPNNITAPYTPIGFFPGDTLRALTIVKPQVMLVETDTIWDNELPEFHDLVPRKVSMDILIGNNGGFQDEATLTSLIRRGGLLREEFQTNMKSAFGRTWSMGGMR